MGTENDNCVALIRLTRDRVRAMGLQFAYPASLPHMGKGGGFASTTLFASLGHLQEAFDCAGGFVPQLGTRLRAPFGGRHCTPVDLDLFGLPPVVID